MTDHEKPGSAVPSVASRLAALPRRIDIHDGPTQFQFLTRGFAVGSEEMTFRCDISPGLPFELVSLSRHDDMNPAQATRWHFTARSRIGKMPEREVRRSLPASYVELTPERRAMTRLCCQGIFFTQTRGGHFSFAAPSPQAYVVPSRGTPIPVPAKLGTSMSLSGGPGDMEFLLLGFACGATPQIFRCNGLGLMEFRLVALSKHLARTLSKVEPWYFRAECSPASVPNRLVDPLTGAPVMTGKEALMAAFDELPEFQAVPEEERPMLKVDVEGVYDPATRRGAATFVGAHIAPAPMKSPDMG
jgi:hypothetical protein